MFLKILFPFPRIGSTSNRTKTKLTLREVTTRKHQHNNHLLNHLKNSTFNKLSHPTIPFLPYSRTSLGKNINPVFFNPIITNQITSLKYFSVYELATTNSMHSQYAYTPIIFHSSHKVWEEIFHIWGYVRKSCTLLLS